jgi:hypothetical protein
MKAGKMSQVRKLWFTADEESEADRREANRQTASLGGLAIALFLVVVGLYLVRHLHAEAALEDCLLSGQSSCTVPGPTF